MTEKKRSYSSAQPSGIITLGNYLGAIKNWVALQDDYECIYSIADLHAITVRQEPAKLRKQSLELLATMLACGIDPEKSLLFVQSHVHQHAELAWILNCYTQMGELSRMTQFKDKSRKNESNINAGLFSYPTLMAADILLYQADVVPVGQDQMQHLELCRDIAARFNGVHGDVFKVPEGLIPKAGERIKSLQTPAAKMSKSDENENSYISIVEPADSIMRKFKRAVTDSGSEVVFAEGKDGINNLLTIYSVIAGISIAKAQDQFAGKGYGDFKAAVGEAVAEHLRPIREKYEDLIKNKDYIIQVVTKSDEIAAKIAAHTLRKVYKKVGFLQF